MTERAVVGNASDEGQIRAGAAGEKQRAALLRLDWRHVLSTAEGQRVIWSVLEHCGMHETPYSIDAIPMAFKVGRLDVGNFLVAQINDAKPDAYVEMMLLQKQQREAAKRPSKRQLQEEAIAADGQALTDSPEDSGDGNA